MLPAQLVTDAEKPIKRSSPPAIGSEIYSLGSAKSSRLVPEPLDKFFPIDPVLKFPLH
jgi:hypothetical protein